MITETFIYNEVEVYYSYKSLLKELTNAKIIASHNIENLF